LEQWQVKPNHSSNFYTRAIYSERERERAKRGKEMEDGVVDGE